MSTTLDLLVGRLTRYQMLGLMNCQERTLGHFIETLKHAGWKVDRVCRFEAPMPQQIICVPV